MNFNYHENECTHFAPYLNPNFSSSFVNHYYQLICVRIHRLDGINCENLSSQFIFTCCESNYRNNKIRISPKTISRTQRCADGVNAIMCTQCHPNKGWAIKSWKFYNCITCRYVSTNETGKIKLKIEKLDEIVCHVVCVLPVCFCCFCCADAKSRMI